MTGCMNCGVETSNPKFCNRSCSITYNNKRKPKRRRQYVLSEGPQEKPCSRCKVIKSFSDFTIEDGYRPSSRCKACTNEMMKLLYARRDRPSVAAYKRLRMYGLTEDQYQALLRTQKGSCALCRKRPAACVDHDHETGRVRGLLCSSCNLALGILGDSAEAIAGVLVYLTATNGEAKVVA